MRSPQIAPLLDSTFITLRFVARALLERAESRLGEVVWHLSPRRVREVGRRRRARDSNGGRWFGEDEQKLVRVLAATIIPSDADSPGAEDAGVADALDRLVAGSATRQLIYERGLFALDEVARRGHARPFVNLTPAQQIALLTRIDGLHQTMFDNRSIRTKIWSRVRVLHRTWNGSFAAAELFATVVRDTMQVFYTHPVSWVWLGYDGPPMPHGYPARQERSPDVRRAEYERVGLWG
jgi:Gluconate 2-dehydrogenase subunit 3